MSEFGNSGFDNISSTGGEFMYQSKLNSKFISYDRESGGRYGRQPCPWENLEVLVAY